MRMHRCNWQGCNVRVQMGDKFCENHTMANQKRRDDYMESYKAGIKGSMKEAHDMSIAQAKYDMESRDQDAQAFYLSTRWKHTANHLRVRDSYTSAITGQILRDTDTQVDHIVKRSLLPESEWYNSDNLWLLSRKEHQLKTNMEAKMIREGKGDMLRHLSKEWWTKVLMDRLYGN